MPLVPSQLRSADPFGENRFSNVYNLRSRMLTNGVDSVVFLESFALEITDDLEIKIGPGIAIKDDVMIHILDDVTIDLTQNQGYMVSGESEPPWTEDGTDKTLHLCLHYHYARSMPAPQARYVLMEDPTLHYTTVNHMWLGYLNIVGGVVVNFTYNPIVINNYLYERHIINVILGYTSINGGVIRPPIPGGTPVGWYEEWEYY